MVAVSPEVDPGNPVLADDEGIHLANILRGEEDARDQVDLQSLDDVFLLPVGGLKECDIKAVLGNSGEILRALMIPSELRYWCVARPSHRPSPSSDEVSLVCWIRNLPEGISEQGLRDYIRETAANKAMEKKEKKVDLEPKEVVISGDTAKEVVISGDTARLSFEKADEVIAAIKLLNETNYLDKILTASATCGRKHARKPLRCCDESMVPCQGADGHCADYVCVHTDEKSGRICGKKFFDPEKVPVVKCTKCGNGSKEKPCVIFAGRARFVCKKCGYRMQESEYCGKGHCCKDQLVHDLQYKQAPYECRECHVKYNRSGVKCCDKPVQPTARYICLGCRKEYLENDGDCGTCGKKPVAVSGVMSICGSCVQPDPRRSSASRRPTLLPIITSGRTDASELEVRQEDIDHLNEQSLIDTDYTVSVEARSLPPSFKASQACEVKILATLAERGNDVLLRTKIAQAVISTAWIQFRLHTALDIFLQVWVVLALAICSFEVRYERTPYGWLIFLVVLHAKRSVEEVSQWLTNCAEAERRKGWKKVLAELFALDNVADLFFIIVGWFALIRRLALPLGIDAWMAAFCAWNWLKLLYSLRGELWIGPRLLPIFFALRESLGFFFVVFMAVAASSHAYYDLQLRREAAEVVDGKWYRPLFEAYTAVLQIGRLGIWGDFDLYEFEGLDPWLETERDELGNVTGNLNPVDPSPSPDGVYIFAHLLFFVTGVGVTVLLMNLLIGILSTDFGLYEQKSTELFNRARAKMMKEIGNRPSTVALQYAWARWLKLASMAKQPHIVGASACVPMLLKFAVSPWRLVLGRESFELLVETPLVPFVRYSGGCGMVTILLVLLSPVIFVLSLAILIISLIPAAALRVTALRHLLNGGLGVRADDANQSAWFASQCGIVVFYGGDSDGYSGTRKAFEATRGALRETRTSVEESLIFIKAHVGVPLTKEEEDLLKSLRAKRALPRGLSLRQEAIERSLIYIKHHLGLDLKDDEERILKDILPDGRANSPPLPPPEHPPSDPRASGSDLEIFEKRQQERMNTMECRLNDLHRGLNEATDRLTWACQVLYKTSTQVEDLHRSHEHLVGFIEQRLVGYSGDGNQVRPGRGSFPTAQRRPSPSYQPDYSFQYPVEDGRAQGSPRNPNGAEVVTVNISPNALQ